MLPLSTFNACHSHDIASYNMDAEADTGKVLQWALKESLKLMKKVEPLSSGIEDTKKKPMKNFGLKKVYCRITEPKTISLEITQAKS